jgi:hypothetical protein
LFDRRVPKPNTQSLNLTRSNRCLDFAIGIGRLDLVKIQGRWICTTILVFGDRSSNLLPVPCFTCYNYSLTTVNLSDLDWAIVDIHLTTTSLPVHHNHDTAKHQSDRVILARSIYSIVRSRVACAKFPAEITTTPSGHLDRMATLGIGHIDISRQHK